MLFKDLTNIYNIARITLKKGNLSIISSNRLFYFRFKRRVNCKKMKNLFRSIYRLQKNYHQKTVIYKLNELSKSEELDSTKTIIKIEKNDIVVLKS